MFHLGLFMAFGGHVIGVLIPKFVTESVGIDEHLYHFIALAGGIPAGILIAAIVWISPQAKNFRFAMIFFFVYFIALGDFTHVVVGSCEMAYEVIEGNADFFTYCFKFLIPTIILMFWMFFKFFSYALS